MARKAPPMSAQQNDRAKDRAAGLRPNKGQEIRTLSRPEGRTWHNVTPYRSAAALPSSSRPPIRARQARADKGLPGYRSPLTS